jgi:hypothetical protein
MPTVRIVGGSGAVQIDERWCNYMLVGKGSISAGSGFEEHTVTVGGVAPLVVWSGECWVACAKSALSGSTWTFTLATSGGGTFTWFAFDQGIAESTGPALRLRREADNALIFDSGNPFARVAGVVTDLATLSMSTTAPQTYGYVSGRAYAVGNLQNPYASRNTVLPPAGPQDPRPRFAYEKRLLTCKGQSGQVQALAAIKASTPLQPIGSTPPPAGTYGDNASIIALDVTGY